MPTPDDVTLLLRRARRGESVTGELMPLIYDELHRLARRHMRSERAGHTLQPTALVHEAYLRLVGSDNGPWQDRAHFFAVAANVVRRILVQHARARRSQKRGGDRQRVSLDEVQPAGAEITNDRVLAVDEALERLAELDPAKARLVELRFFAGLTNAEIADATGVSERTVARGWDFARAWLSRALREDGDAVR